jgi:hypothetical protein
MSASPDRTPLDSLLARSRRRLLALRALEGAAVGAVVASAAALLTESPVTEIAAGLLIAAGVLIRAALGEAWRPGWWRRDSDVARHVERRAPECRNLLVTAAEIREANRPGYVTSIVMRRADTIANGLVPARLFPAKRAGVVATVGGVLLVAALVQSDTLRDGPVVSSVMAADVPRIHRVDVTATPPAYTRRDPLQARDPSRLEVLEGTSIALRIEAAAASLTVETLAGTREASAVGGAFVVSVPADGDGFIAIEPRNADGLRGGRRLIALRVKPDAPPRVRLASPGRDLFFSTIPDTLSMLVEAEDDLALASLRLQYTVVSGSGERFTFVEHDLPLRVAQSDAMNWVGRSSWRLDQLQLEPGDLLVYRALARDGRPGAAEVGSDSYVIEVVTPGAIASEGFAADDERDRYAISQQMVILKTERLIANRQRMARDSVEETARLLAAEQRQVRAEFVFMMGGELEDAAEETSGTLEVNEVAEAEAEDDILAGRLENRGRIEMMRAIRAMSRASALLSETNLEDALRSERVALDNLMRAFSRSRFILRALTQRERLDLSRRLSGTLADARGLNAPIPVSEVDDRSAALRRLIVALAALHSDTAQSVRESVAESARLLLRNDPSSPRSAEVAARAEQLAVPGSLMDPASVDSLIVILARQFDEMLPRGARSRASIEASRISGAWRDALRLKERR